jgi:hypothetical protein
VKKLVVVTRLLALTNRGERRLDLGVSHWKGELYPSPEALKLEKAHAHALV